MTNRPDYADEFEDRLQKARDLANKAKSKRGDPKPEVEIPVAEDMAERCEKLLEREYGNKIHGLAQIIRDLEDGDEVDGREEMSLKLAEEFAQGDLSKDFDNNAERVEAAIRTSVAILTEGVVAAPIEGIGIVEIEKNDDGTEFIRLPYFGPIRSAGGTAQAVSVLVADYVRELLDLAEFKPRDDEVERYLEEIKLYDSQTGMQYCPKDDEGRFIIRNTPIMVDGTPNKQVGREVDGYRDLERIEGNHPRDGMALVMAEGIALKAPKLQRYSEAFDLQSWSWLEDLIQGNYHEDEAGDDEDTGAEDEAGDDEEEDEAEEEMESVHDKQTPIRFDEINHAKPKKKYMSDAIAGRPIFSGPGQKGGFRLRYGRARNMGHAAVGYHPATMHITNDFIAACTQIKTERPGKAAGAVPVDSIEGPVVKLYNGTVKRIDTAKEAKELQDQVETIIDLGETAVPFGEFEENNHPLAPGAYSKEWWEQELKKAGGDPETVSEPISVSNAKDISQTYDIPIHPEYTYVWHDLTPEQYAVLTHAVNTKADAHDDETTILPDKVSDILEILLVPHKQTDGEIHLDTDVYEILNDCTPAEDEQPIEDDVLGQVNNFAPYTVRAKAPTRIGARMGRPEKAERREMKPHVNALFPIGDAGNGNMRRLDKAAHNTEGADNQIDGSTNNGGEYKGKGTIDADVANMICPSCQTQTWKARCPNCNTRTEPTPICPSCQTTGQEPGERCKKCGTEVGLSYDQTIDINTEYNDALDALTERQTTIGKVKAVKRLSSKSKIPEPLEKGLLRAKHDISTFRDGTARYDMTDLPTTSFKPEEIDITVEQAHELGYTKTITGERLTDPDQLVEMKMQDVIVAEEGAQYMLDVANYIDDLLVKYYDMDPYYEAETVEDLIGELIIGMAPHTSAGVLGRIIGVTSASTNYAHPFFHAAKRRNCFHPETELTIKINGDWERTTIEELVETYLEPDSDGYDDTYDDGTVVQQIENHPHIEELKVPSMTDEGHRTIENVTHLSKHQAPDHMITIKTECGDKLQVTPDHKIPVKGEDELIVEKQAHQVEENDKLFDYSMDKIDEVKEYTEIDILEHLIRKPDEHKVKLENVMIRDMEKEQVYDLLREKIKPNWDGRFYKMKSSCEYLDITKKTLDNYLRRESIPVTLILKLYDGDIEEVLKNIPNNVELGMNSDNISIPRKHIIDEELACFIGYYTAEGYCRTEKDPRSENQIDSLNQVDIAATEDEARDFIKSVLKKRFNIDDPYKNKKRFTASGKIIKYFFSSVLNNGDNCYTKRIPEQIKDSSKNIKLHYLSGYLSGDGGSWTGMFMTAFTASEELKEDTIELLESVSISSYCEEAEPKLLREKFPDFYDEDDDSMSAGGYRININEQEWYKFSQDVGFQLSRKNKTNREYDTKTVENVAFKKCNSDDFYNITVSSTNKFSAVESLSRNCDGDEDSVMLLMDGLINFSRSYLPDQRGKNMMDAPIVMSTILDPEEIDDEAHNVDIVDEYPLSFFEATLHNADPDSVDITLAEDRLDDPTGFGHSLETSDINAGPKNSAYKTLGDMDEKLGAQLELSEMSRGVDEKKVASLVVEKHFFPDIIGNLTAFARQEFMCRDCGMKHRRAPANEQCLRDDCDGDVSLTVYEGMVDKYVETAEDMAEKYDLRMYTKQRLERYSENIESLFKDDKEEQTQIEDFF